MALRRARLLSSECRMYHGACFVSVASSIMSRAREYSNHLVRDGRSIGLSFHWRRESAMLFFRAKAHHILHPGAIVPTAIEDHYLAGGGEVLHVTLDIHLRLLAIRGRRQCD